MDPELLDPQWSGDFFQVLHETPEICVSTTLVQATVSRSRVVGKIHLTLRRCCFRFCEKWILLFVGSTPWCFRSFTSSVSGDMINMGTVVKCWAKPASLRIAREKDPSDPENRLHIYSIQLCVLYIKYINLEDQQKEKTPVFNIVAVSIYEAQDKLKCGENELKLDCALYYAFEPSCNACGAMHVVSEV